MTSKYDVRSAHSPAASLKRSLWAMRMLQTGWPPVGVRSSGSRVRLPEIVSWLMSNPLMLVFLLLVVDRFGPCGLVRCGAGVRRVGQRAPEAPGQFHWTRLCAPLGAIGIWLPTRRTPALLAGLVCSRTAALDVPRRMPGLSGRRRPRCAPGPPRSACRARAVGPVPGVAVMRRLRACSRRGR